MGVAPLEQVTTHGLAHPEPQLGTSCDGGVQAFCGLLRHAEGAVVERPTRRGGRGLSLIGQHEILVPLLAAGVIEAFEQAGSAKQQQAKD